MRVLIALLGVLLVANARVLRRQYENSTETSEFSTSEEPLNETTEQPEYLTTEQNNSTSYDYLWNDTYTDNYNPQTYIIQCGYTDQTTYYLGAFAQSAATFDVSSNTLENTTYANNRNCTIQFVAGANPVWLSVHLEEFDLENSTRCYYDFLCIKGAKFCGRASNPWTYLSYSVPANETFTINFYTDSSVISNGFRFKVYTSEAYGYSSSYEPYGIVSNPTEIYNYREVSAENYVDNCLNASDPIYETVSSDYSTRSYYSTSSYAESAQVIQCYEGATESFYSVFSNDPSLNSYNMNDYFGNYNNNNRYVFTTPNFGASTYGNNTSCKIHFQTSSVPQTLNVYFSDFDVEATGNCVYDYLCVNGVNLCSNWAQYQSFYYNIPAYSTFTINFQSDLSIDRSGVRAYINFDDSSSTSYGSYEATSGDGSQESTVVYSYTDIYSYQDRCSDSYQNPTTVNYPTYYTDYNNDYITGSRDSNNFRESYLNAIENNLVVADERIEVAKDLIENLQSDD